MTDQEKMPEAIASATYQIESPNGFQYLFTVRGTDETNLLERMGDLEQYFMAGGFKPQRGSIKTSIAPKKKTTTPEKTTTSDKKVCPKCGGKLLYKTTKNGENFVECENREYDYETQEASGCPYIKWNVKAPSASGEPATKKQKDFILEQDPNAWEEGMSKKEAIKVIDRIING